MSLLKANKSISAPNIRFLGRNFPTRYNGHSAVRIAQAVYDVSGGDSGAIGSHGLGVTIPDNAVIVDAWVDIVTTFADGVSDGATIALTVQSAGDLTAAIAISDASNVWDAGVHGTKIGNFALDGNSLTQVAMAAARAATFLKLTADREITATVAVAALTAGKMVVNVAYVLGD